jgi:hypothetical protein
MAGRRSIARGVAGAALALLALPLLAAEPAPPRLSSLEAALDRIFRAVQVSGLRPDEGTAARQTGAPHHTESDPGHVLMVRVKDGKPVLACVDSHEAASRFLEAPVRTSTAKAEEK